MGFDLGHDVLLALHLAVLCDRVFARRLHSVAATIVLAVLAHTLRSAVVHMLGLAPVAFLLGCVVLCEVWRTRFVGDALLGKPLVREEMVSAEATASSATGEHMLRRKHD